MMADSMADAMAIDGPRGEKRKASVLGDDSGHAPRRIRVKETRSPYLYQDNDMADRLS